MPEQPLDFLSEPWVSAFVEAAAGLPERPGASATLAVTVVGGPEGRKAERAWYLDLRDGKVASAGTGPRPDGDADLAVAQPWDDALAALDGAAGLDVGFMRGSTKVVGRTGALMDLLPVLRSAEWQAACRSLASRTAR